MEDSAVTERKTPDSKTEDNNTGNSKPSEVVQSGLKNVLYNYRSFTYNFTLAALRKSDVNDPKKYRDSALDFIILTSGGKGSQQINVSGDLEARKEAANKKYQQAATSMSATVESVAAAKTELDSDVSLLSSTPGLVAGFNQNSPGRFDMFIDNVEIESLMTFSEQAGASLPTSIKFEVLEPYSINGFIEAIHVGAVSAGYPSYMGASFVLKMDFIGYPDNEKFSDPEIVEKGTRYFTFGFTGMEVEITEKGTRYRCTAVPFNELGFGQPNDIKKPIKMSGSTVKEMLTTLLKNVEQQVVDSDKESKKTTDATKHDKYEIKFPAWDDTNGFDDTKDNEIAGAKILELLKENSIYQFPDPGTSNKPDGYKSDDKTQPTPQEKAKAPESVKYSPATKESDPAVQFKEGAKIHECIASVIRDSEYIRNILKTLGQNNNPDEFGMIKYFLIKMEVTNQETINLETKKPYQTYTYSVTPYKMHYTRVPGYSDQKIDASKLKTLSLREYNYIYTGQNSDVINFRLKFDTLFFEAMPQALAANDKPAAQTAAGNSNGVDIKSNPQPIERTAKEENGTAPQKVDASLTKVQPSAGGRGGQIKDDPYSTMAVNMHEAVTNSKASMIQGELEILGDPFFLVTGGIGNYNPKPAGKGVTDKGEAAHNYSEVLVTVNFRNPIDIGKDGMAYFDTKKVPFSGVYRVLKCVSHFKEGQFKQNLELVRIPGQILQDDPMKGTKSTGKIAEDTSVREDLKPDNPADRFTISPDPQDQVMPDTTIATNAGDRPSELNLLTQLGRGLPSPGLPGELSNFTNATGGLGGVDTSLLTQVSGAVTNKGLGSLTAGADIFGGAIPGGLDQLSSGIRLQTAGLLSQNQSGLQSAAFVSQVSGSMEKAVPSLGTAKTLSAQLISNYSQAGNAAQVLGSGIGEGATIKIDNNSPLATVVTQNNLTAKAFSAVSGMGSTNAAGLLNQAKDKTAALFGGSLTDPTAIAGKFGINASQLSGLSPGLQSKVLEQASNLAKDIPENVDLSSITAQGISLEFIPASKLANLPATAPYATAPSPVPDQKFLDDIMATKGPDGLANAYGVSDITKISGNLLPTGVLNSLVANASEQFSNPFSNAYDSLGSINAEALGGKLMSGNSMLTALTGASGSIEGNLSSVKSIAGAALNSGNLAGSVTEKFGSLTKGTSPLDKIMLSSAKNVIGGA